MKGKNIRVGLIISTFLIVLFFPLINQNFKIINDIKNFENRALAKKPVFKTTEIDSFPKYYEKYYNDAFPLRSSMLKAFNYFNFFIFNKLPNSDFVIIGKDRWLFLAGEEFEAYTGKNNLTGQELVEIKNELEFRQKYLEERNCKFYLMITPAKAVIYPEKTPFEQLRFTDKSLGEELHTYLKKNSSVNLIDLFPVLRENKKNYPTYYATDNHWTRPGAFYSANQFLKQVHSEYPEVSPMDLNNFIISKKDTADGNTASILGNTELFPDTSYLLSLKNKPQATNGKKAGYRADTNFAYFYMYEQVKEIKNSNKPRLLIISDSFGTDIFPLLSENFSKTVKIWDNWEYKLNEEIVENEKPDVFLLIIHEKNLRNLMKHRSSDK
jgi:alginate O-acetyltransferase complex protein AlgJ